MKSCLPGTLESLDEALMLAREKTRENEGEGEERLWRGLEGARGEKERASGQ